MKSLTLGGVLLLSVIMLTGCAAFGGKTAPPEVVTGQTIEALLVTFLDTAALYDQLYKEKMITAKDYQEWRSFVERAKPILIASQKAWKASVSAGKPMDASTQAQVLAMKRELLIFAAKLAVKKGA